MDLLTGDRWHCASGEACDSCKSMLASKNDEYAIHYCFATSFSIVTVILVLVILIIIFINCYQDDFMETY